MHQLRSCAARSRVHRLPAAGLALLLGAGALLGAGPRLEPAQAQARPAQASPQERAAQRRLLQAAQVVSDLLPQPGDAQAAAVVEGALPGELAAQIAWLSERARQRGAASRLRGDGHRPAVALQAWNQELLVHGHAFASLAALQREAQAGLDAMHLHRAAHLLCATLFVSQGAPPPEEMGEGDAASRGRARDQEALAATALALLGVLQATPGVGDTRLELALLAHALGQARLAQRLALELPPDEPLRAYLLRDRARLAALAAGGAPYTRYLAQRDLIERGESSEEVLTTLGVGQGPGTVIYSHSAALHGGAPALAAQLPAQPLLVAQLQLARSGADLRAERAVGAGLLLHLAGQLGARPLRALPRPIGRLSRAELLLLLAERGLAEPAQGGLAMRLQAALARAQAPCEGALLNTALWRGFLRGQASAVLAALGEDPAPRQRGEALVLGQPF